LVFFLPPYSPELNPAEKIWLTIKRNFENRLFEPLEKLVEFIFSSLKKITTEKVKSISSFKYIFGELY
jgi:transposase